MAYIHSLIRLFIGRSIGAIDSHAHVVIAHTVILVAAESMDSVDQTVCFCIINSMVKSENHTVNRL